MRPKLKYIAYGIAYTMCNKGKRLYIELNENLKKRKYSGLKKEVLTHEMLHWNAKGWWENFKIDFFDIFDLKKHRQLTKFCLENPRTYLANSPFFFEHGKIVPNWFLVGFWSIILISLIGGAIFII